MSSKDRDDKAPQPKRPILEYPGVLEAFHGPLVQQDRPPQVQQEPPPPEQPPPSPKVGWSDPDEFLASSDLYLAQVPSSIQKHKSASCDNPTISRPTESHPDDKEDIQEFLRQLEQSKQSPPALNSKPKAFLQRIRSGPEYPLSTSRPTESQRTSDEPDDKEYIQNFLRKLERAGHNPSAPTNKPRSPHQGHQSGPASPPSQANITARQGSERDISSQQPKPYTVRAPAPRRAPKEKDPTDLDFREDHFD